MVFCCLIQIQWPAVSAADRSLIVDDVSDVWWWALYCTPACFNLTVDVATQAPQSISVGSPLSQLTVERQLPHSSMSQVCSWRTSQQSLPMTLLGLRYTPFHNKVIAVDWKLKLVCPQKSFQNLQLWHLEINYFSMFGWRVCRQPLAYMKYGNDTESLQPNQSEIEITQFKLDHQTSNRRFIFLVGGKRGKFPTPRSWTLQLFTAGHCAIKTTVVYVPIYQCTNLAHSQQMCAYVSATNSDQS